jgi:peroxiredoxin (alkyl hydroperoxide reductase subunit C)
MSLSTVVPTGDAKVVSRDDAGSSQRPTSGRRTSTYGALHGSEGPKARRNHRMSIMVGRPVPHVAAEAYIRDEPEAVRLSPRDFHGSWVVLFFYPRDFSFVCPTELQAFADLHDDFEAEDAVVLAASTDSYWSHRAWFESNAQLLDVRYPVLADTAHDLAEACGVLLPDGSALRATLIIDPEGAVRHLSVSDNNVGRSPEETLRVLQALRTGELCPVDWRPGQPTVVKAA